MLPQPNDDTPVLPEALAAAVGVTRLLDDTKFRVTVADKSRAEMMPREIRRALGRFVNEDNGPQKIGKMAPFDYGWALDHLTEAIDPASPPDAPPTINTMLAEELAAGFKPEDHDLAGGFLVIAQRNIPYLQSILPIRVEQTQAQKVNYDPSDTEIARFRRAFNVADDPMVVLADLENGTLVSDQIRHLGVLYPDMLALVKAQLGNAMAEALGRKKSWKLPWRKERLVQVVYGTDTMSRALQQELQSNFQKPDQQNPAPAPSKATGKTASMYQSQTQATADGDIRKA